MSKIALEGNSLGSGTFTIAAPNSNSNPTLTLPTSSGTVVVTGGAQTIEFAAGSAASPSITFTGDTNTGIFSPGADTIAFSEGGVESMRIDSSGNVGIGTSSPSSRLEIVGVNPKLTINANDTVNGRNATLSLISGTSGDPSSTCQIMYGASNSTSAGTLVFVEGDGTERMRIDSSGNVLVGTTGITGSFAGRVFNLFGTGIVRNIVQSTGQFAVYNIGSGGTSAIPTVSGFMLTDSTAGTLNIYASTNHPMLFGTNNTERARIDSNGKFLQSLGNFTAYSYNTNSGSSYTVSVPGSFAIYELSIYAARNNSGDYGTRYQVYHIGSLDGYPYSAWAPTTNLVSDMGRNQTGAAPGISISAGVNGSITVTISGTGTLYSGWALRTLCTGPGY